MKRNLLYTLIVTSLLSAAPLHAEEAKDAKPATAEELEAKFKETMTAAVMSGRWCPVKDGVLGEEKEDKYSIVSAEKGSANSWVINARMQYGGREVVLPIPVQLKWAGDTAVMIVDSLRIPGLNGYGGAGYSARVLFYGNTYAGTWSGSGHGGLLKGVISKEKPATPEAK
jgi:hypothetical protein